MPSYLFECLDCEKKYSDLTKYDETGIYPDISCPVCSSKNKNKLPTVCMEVVFIDPRGTSKGDNFSYVAGFNMEQAKGERRAAEAKSHMGKTPYNNIDDLGKDNNFDFSKI